MNTYTFTSASEIITLEADTYNQALEELMNYINSRDEDDLKLWIYRGE